MSSQVASPRALVSPSRAGFSAGAVVGVLLGIGTPAFAQQTVRELRPTRCAALPYVDAGGSVALPQGWYSGDPHDHIQLCSGDLIDVEDIVARMVDKDLDVGHPLIWGGLPDTPFDYTNQVCRVTGDPEPAIAGKIVQFGVETSGLQGATWGHLIGLNLTLDEVVIAVADPANGACYFSATGLGFACPGGDGTGLFSAPIADFFGKRPDVVRGVAHQAWATGIYSDAPLAYAWYPLLVQTGRTTDAVCLDPTRKLAFPILGALSTPQVLTPFAPMDAVCGKVEYLETVDMESDYAAYTGLDAAWYGTWYKLLSAGLRLSVAGGSDVDCANVTGRTSEPRTFVRVDGALDYDGWIGGLAAGQVSLAMGNDLFLDLQVQGQEIGSQVSLSAQATSVPVRAVLRSNVAVQDRIEIVRNGEVVASKRVRLPSGGGTARFELPALALDESSWIAARLCSNRAHTGASYVTLGDRPIANCLDAEYWMVWCDLFAQTIEQFPVFACQKGEVLQHIGDSRTLFRSLRDIDAGFDPDWQAQRIGRSTPACAGPIPIGLDTPPVEGQDTLRLNCFHAPARANGVLFVSDRAPLGGSTSFQGVPVFFDPEAKLLLGIPVRSEPNGGCSATIPGLEGLPAGTKLYAQFLWSPSAACATGEVSASDALELTVLPAPGPDGVYRNVAGEKRRKP